MTSSGDGDTYRSLDDDVDVAGDTSLSLSAEESIDAVADRDERRAALLSSMSSEPSDTYLDDAALSDDEQNAEATAAVPLHLHRRYTCGGLSRGCLLSQPAYAASIAAIVVVLLSVIAAILLAAVLPYVVAGTASTASISVSAVRISYLNDSSFVLTLTAALADTGALTADVAPMNVAMFLVSDVDGSADLFGSFTAPAATLSGGGAVIAVNSTLSVASADAFADFIRAIIHDANVQLRLSASATVTPYIAGIALPQYSGVDFTKTITLAGADGLSDTRIVDVKMNTSTETALAAQLTLVTLNPSDFELAPLGRLLLTLRSDGQRIADLRSLDQVQLAFGNNTFDMSATFDNTSAALNAVFVQFLCGQSSNVTVTASDNATDIALFQVGMNGTNIATEFPPYEKTLINEMSFTTMALLPSPLDLTLIMDANVIVTINSPFDETSPLNLETVTINATLNIDSAPFASFTIQSVHVQPLDNSGAAPSTFTFAMADVRVTLLEDGALYQTFIASLLHDDNVPLSISAVSNVTLNYVAGRIVLPDTNISTATPLDGMSGLNLHLSAINVSSRGDIDLFAVASNPSVVTLTLGTVDIALNVTGERVAVLSASSFNVTSQSVEPIALSGRIDGTPNVLSTLLSGVLSSQPTNVQIAADFDIDDASALALTLSQMDFDAIADAQNAQLIPAIRIDYLNFDFARTDDLRADANMTAAFVLPSNIALNTSVDQAALRFTFYSNDAFATLISPDVPVVQAVNASADGTNALSLTVPPSLLLLNQTAAFQRFAEQLFTTANVNVSLIGSSDFETQTQFGTLSIAGARTNSNLSFAGFNQFLDERGDPLLHVDSVQVIDANSSMLTLSLVMSVTNPSSIALSNLGALRLDLLYNNSVIATLNVANMSIPSALSPRMNVFAYVPILSGDNVTALTNVLSAHLNVQNQTVALAGSIRQSDGTYVAGTDIDVLSSAIMSLTTAAVIPAAAQPLVAQIRANISCAFIQTALCGVQNPHLMPATLTVNNAFAVSLHVTAADIVVSVQNGATALAVGEWILPSPQNQCNYSADIRFDADSTSVSAPICIDFFALSYAELAPIIKSLLDEQPPPLSAIGSLTINMSSSADAYSTIINLRAVDVPIVVAAEWNETCFVC